MSRVLILKFGAIGDIVMLIPAARQLHLAGHPIDWVCGPAVLPILQLYPWINPLLADDRAILTGSLPTRLRAILALWRTLRRATRGHRYSLVATLYYDPRYRILALPVRAARRVRLSHSDRAFRLLPGRHHTDEFARILLNRPDQRNPTPLAPVSPEPLPPETLPASPLPPSTRPRIVLAPAGARNMMADDALRRWSPANYVALTRLLLDQIPAAEIVLIGGPGDAWVQPYFASFPVIDLIGRLTLPQTIALLASAAILITHDTGPLHLAGLTTCGIVALFGPTDPRGRLPQRPGTLAIWGGEGFACRPCYDGHSFPACPANDCLAQISPTLVLAQTLAMLDDRARGILAAPRIVSPPSTIPPSTLIQLP